MMTFLEILTEKYNDRWFLFIYFIKVTSLSIPSVFLEQLETKFLINFELFIKSFYCQLLLGKHDIGWIQVFDIMMHWTCFFKVTYLKTGPKKPFQIVSLPWVKCVDIRVKLHSSAMALLTLGPIICKYS